MVLPGEHDDQATTADDRAAMRAFLQRCEVRLSTMHRVATALLSGAGILVLLPTMERDSVEQVMRMLLQGPISVSRGLLGLAVVLSIGLALAVFWLLVLELTRFYFHSNHVRNDLGELFAPRFTLTGLRLSSDELSPATDRAYADIHRSPSNVELLVPDNVEARERIDRQLSAYPGLVDAASTEPDRARAEALFELAASRRRTLAEEVSKVEYGIVRHVIRLQVIVLRYVKALLVILVTSIAIFSAAAAVSGHTAPSAADERWIAGVLASWAPVVMFVAGSPVRWLERLLRAEGAQHTAVGNDAELTRVEDVAVRVGAISWAVAASACVLLLVDHDVTRPGRVALIAVVVATAGAVAWQLVVRLRAQQQRSERLRATHRWWTR